VIWGSGLRVQAYALTGLFPVVLCSRDEILNVNAKALPVFYVPYLHLGAAALRGAGTEAENSNSSNSSKVHEP
jgi:hypothetical protein